MWPGIIKGAWAVAAGRKSSHCRLNSLRFLQSCLGSMLDVRAPGDCRLPGGAADKLAASLFPPATRTWCVEAQSDTTMPQHGVKTKLQMLAERSVRPPPPLLLFRARTWQYRINSRQCALPDRGLMLLDVPLPLRPSTP